MFETFSFLTIHSQQWNIIQNLNIKKKLQPMVEPYSYLVVGGEEGVGVGRGGWD